MKQILKEKKYNKFKDQQLCEFTFDTNIKCNEFGANIYTETYLSLNYTAIGESPILGCFSFYVNIYGLSNGEITKDKLSSISIVFGSISVAGVLIIANILKNSIIKYKKL